jgi:hypothetical protein
MPDQRFVEAVLDPSLIPAVYNGCDQWCDYCPLTERCLAFRCRPANGSSGDIYHDVAEAMAESMRELKAAHEAQGVAVPEALEWLLRNDSREPMKYEPIDDPLERLGRRYLMLAGAYLVSRSDVSLDIPRRSSGPTPLDLVVRYHMLIAAKIYRAVISSRRAARSADEGAAWDANISAKVALLCAERSDEAWAVLALDDADPRIGHVRQQLRRVLRELEARFPGARALVRPGFDTTDI